jgi:hypothetical protein
MARGGLRTLRLLDGDYVDPATLARWPMGLSVAARLKTDALAELIARDYPRTRVLAWSHRLGTVGNGEVRGVRMAAATLCGEADGGDPDCDWDLLSIALRTSDGRPIPPRWDAFRLEPHRACEACGRSAA